MEYTPETINRALNETPLFHGVDAAFSAHAAAKGYREHFAAGETILSEGEEKHRLGILLSGSAEVFKPAGGANVPMNRLAPGDLLGAASLFSSDAHAVTAVVAAAPCDVLFFDEETLKALMQENFTLAENYFAYLTGRIHFLTGRIESIASPTAAEKLWNHLLRNAEGGAVELSGGFSRLASTLCISRASLYRVLDELEQQGRIARQGKKILLLDSETEQ
ncbi:MAG: Crp/Fnr family transcriptional regulator [Clostridiales bacterium]|nr:Crp/Fnr family transcriptional regulator [Clostridiales bacterium]